jgi:mono/diheme cytochrome c family protein
VITGVFPDSAAVGDTILVAGSGFGDVAGTSTLSIGGATATVVVSWSNTRLIAGVPSGASGGSVIVTVNGQSSGSVAFRVKPVAEARISYAGQLVPLFTANGCTGCHGGTNNLFVTPYASLMAGTSSHGPVVTPYDGEGSVIVRKLRGTAGFGNRMPQGGPFLSEAEIELVARWIKQGARDN